MKRAVAGSAACLTTALAHLAALTDCAEESQSSSAALLYSFHSQIHSHLSHGPSRPKMASRVLRLADGLGAVRAPIVLLLLLYILSAFVPAQTNTMLMTPHQFSAAFLRLSAFPVVSPPSPTLPSSTPHACTQILSRSNKHLHLPHILTNISGKHRA